MTHSAVHETKKQVLGLIKQHEVVLPFRVFMFGLIQTGWSAFRAVSCRLSRTLSRLVAEIKWQKNIYRVQSSFEILKNFWRGHSSVEWNGFDLIITQCAACVGMSLVQSTTCHGPAHIPTAHILACGSGQPWSRAHVADVQTGLLSCCAFIESMINMVDKSNSASLRTHKSESERFASLLYSRYLVNDMDSYTLIHIPLWAFADIRYFSITYSFPKQRTPAKLTPYLHFEMCIYAIFFFLSFTSHLNAMCFCCNRPRPN